MKTWVKALLTVLGCVAIIGAFIFVPSLMALIVCVAGIGFVASFCKRKDPPPKPPTHPTDEELEFFDCMDDK